MSRFGEKCNVTACKERHDGIPHYFSKHKYCWMCARKINDANAPQRIFSKEDMVKGAKVRMERDG